MRKLPILLSLLLLPLSFLPAADALHLVKKSETLYGIAREYGIPVETLIKVNDIKDPKALKIGMSLRIPQTHTVKKGDTLYKIAREYGTTLAVLLELNKLKTDDVLKPGDILLLPGGDKAPAIAADEGREVENTDVTAGSDTLVKTVPINPDETSQTSENSADAGSESEGKAVESDSVSSQPKPDGLLWPHTGERISSDGKFSGTRIIGTRGDAIFAVNTGQVIWEGPYRGFGRVIIVESGNDYIYVYAGNEISLVRVGDSVSPRMEIAKLGNNPHEGRAVLFFSVYKDGKPVDPGKAPRGL